MEEMNMEILGLMDEVMQAGYRRKERGIDKKETDAYGYEYESVKLFSTDPLGFTETGMRLQVEAIHLFNMAAKANRFSPDFYRMSGQLEKLIAQLGSICLTKAVLEQQGQTFDMLKDIKISWLRGMTAFNFRKSSSAFIGSWSAGHYNAGSVDLSIGWAALDKRLIATEEKIRKIKAGEISFEIRDQEEIRDQRSEIRNTEEEVGNKEPEPRSFAADGRVLPVDRAVIREAQQTAAPQPEVFEEKPVITADLKENEVQTSSETAAEEFTGPADEYTEAENENDDFGDDEEFDDRDDSYFGYPDFDEYPPELDHTILPQLFQKLRIPMPQAPPG